MQNTSKTTSIWVLMSLLAVGVVAADDWPHYRGPEYTGTVPADGLFQGRTFGFEVDWIRELGSGYSSISVVGDVGVTMDSDGTSDLLVAFDTATGAERWRYTIGPIYKGHSGSSDGPTSTPTISGNAVYAIDPHGVLVAVTLDEGKKLWRHKLGEDVTARVPHYGFSTSPVVIGDTVIVMTGDASGHTFTGFDSQTGEIRWHSGDDTTTYQSPFVWQRDGGPKVMALTDHYLVELDPSDGRILWKQEHTITDNESFTPPVLMGKNKLLIMHRHEMAAMKLTWDGPTAVMEEIWRLPRYPQTYSIPVYHEGHLYFLRGQFLTCLDANTGERVWRSRPPGGRALTLLDGHLLIMAESGELVAVEATPAEYREKARVQVLDTRSFTPVSFARGHLFVRNLEQMARVKITAHETLAAAPTTDLRGAFGAFVAELEQADDKNAKLDAFFAEHTRFPIIEEGGLVHFVFRGEVEDIALSLGSDPQVALTRVAGTDFHFHSTELDPAGYWEYNFASYDEARVDPLNPLTIGVEPQIRNELRMPQWPAPDYFNEPGGERGRLDTFSFTSTVREGDRDITVWLPPGYDAGDQRFPLWVVVQGDDALAIGKMDVALDNLIGTKVAPMVVVFVPTEGSELWGDNRDGFVRLLADELVPHLEETYRIQTAPGARGIMGVLAGANIATYAALTKPTTFGKLSVQSFVYMRFGEDLKKLIAEADPAPVAAHITISSHDFSRPGMDAAAEAQELVGLLRDRGVAVHELGVSGAPSWGSWRAQFGSILAWFAPAGSK